MQRSSKDQELWGLRLAFPGGSVQEPSPKEFYKDEDGIGKHTSRRPSVSAF